jgi:glutamine synthetase
MKTGVECEFFLLSNDSEVQTADLKDKTRKPCYDQASLQTFQYKEWVFLHKYLGYNSDPDI